MGRCAEISLSCGHLGRLLLRQGDTGAARALLDEGLVEARQTGDLRLVTPVLVTLGRLESRQGEFATARAHHEEALQMCHSRGDRHGTASALQGLAILARAAEAADRAARLWGAAETALRAAGATMPPRERADADQEIALVRAALGEKAFGAAWTAGLEMDREDAIAYALSGTAECTERNRCQETE